MGGGLIKLIYIDPPYNTGSDSFSYNDRFNHSTWLTFMKNRLTVAQDLLRDDGVIFISVDDNEQAYLKVLCDEIFGRKNFIGAVTVVNNKGGVSYGHIAKTHDYLLVYQKTNNSKMYLLNDQQKQFQYSDQQSDFDLRPLRNGNITFNRHNRPNLYYPIFVNPIINGSGFNDISLHPIDGWVQTLPGQTRGIDGVWRWGKDRVAENLNGEIIAKKKQKSGYGVYEKYRSRLYRPKSFWDEKEFRTSNASLETKKLFAGKKVFNFPKPVKLIQRIVEISTDKDDIVLDFFAGSGTTGQAVLMQNEQDGGRRRFILIEQLEDHLDVCRRRLIQVLKNENLNDDFIYFELDPLNQSLIENINNCHNEQQLTKILKSLEDRFFLSHELKFPELKTLNENKMLSLSDKKRLALETLDLNQIYLNLAEIDDVRYNVSTKDKALTQAFYN